MRDGAQPTGGTPRPTRRVAAFVVVCVACVALATGYAWRSVARRAASVRTVALPTIDSLAELERPPLGESRIPPATSDVGAERASPSAVPHEPKFAPDDETGGAPDLESFTAPDARARRPERVVLLRHTGLDESFGVASVQLLSAVADDRRATPLRCDRLHFVESRGVCLTTDRFYTTHSIMVFDRDFTSLHRLPLNGVPSRVRLSPDGRLAAVTVFVSGHSYADEGFSTETSIVDTATGERRVTDLEEFEVRRDGSRFRAVDFNFWGVTFAADSDRFYATLGTGGAVYLVEGRVSTGRASIVLEGVECPSLSPDQTRIVFKKRMPAGAGFVWRLHVLDLTTRRTTPLAETRNVDDQVEWLDDAAVLYALPDPSAPSPMVTDVWKTAADGSGTPELFLKGASSPAVLRPTWVVGGDTERGNVLRVQAGERASESDTAWDHDAAASYLDRRMDMWWANAKTLKTGAGETKCLSCHTAVPYALVRPALRRAQGIAAPTAHEERILEIARQRVEYGATNQPYYDHTDAKKIESRGVEAVLNALVLTSRDTEERAADAPVHIRTAMAHLWEVQRADGAWDWLNFGLEPYEAPDAVFHGASVAALAAGSRSGRMASADAKGQAGIERLRGYMRSNFPSQHLFNRTWALLASSRLDGVLTSAERHAVVRELESRQRPDGGWSLADLATWRWTRQDAPFAPPGTTDRALLAESDGYATGLVVYAMRQAGVAADRPAIRKGQQWLRSHQARERTGDPSWAPWRAHSLNFDREHGGEKGEPWRRLFMSDLATAFAALALL